MTKFAINSVGLSKQYRIGQLHGKYTTLREHLTQGVAGLARRSQAEAESREIWALRDISFEIDQGEVVGIIGRNGAGKTTLLRVLSRITEPTSGYADVRGRVGTLLEVGTGFHPELTGRENVYLNGAILGMSRSEINRKFDEIVEFAEVQKFIETPVKRYSSGMYVRLAFSVAAHLNPEIMFVDEVLAVGDVEFQKRCLGKIESVGRSGRTVLFVSHNMSMIARLCERLLLLEGGRLVADGPADDVIGRYLTSEEGTSAWRQWPDLDSAPGNASVRLRSVRVVDSDLRMRETIDVREVVGIEIGIDVLRSDVQFFPWLDLHNDKGALVFSAMDTDPSWREPRKPGRYVTTAWVPEHLLNEGTLLGSVSLKTVIQGRKPLRQASVDAAVSFHVVDRGEGRSARGDFPGRVSGAVRPLLQWTTESADELRELEPARQRASRT
jgi:homopolymeric O-antigen transport system ATP-binding protein